MAVATLVSRITGFIRIVLLAAILGAALSSAFSVANQLPNLIAALVLEATFTAIFVPVLARAERDDPDGGTAFVRRLVTLATTLLLVATRALGGGGAAAGPADAGQRPAGQPAADHRVRLPAAAAGDLLRPVVGVHGNPEHPQRVRAAGLGAGGQQHRRDRHPWVCISLCRASFRWTRSRWATPSCWCSGIGTTLGVVAQTAVLLVAIRKERISLRPLWGLDDRLKRFGGDGRRDGALRADQPGRPDRRQPDRQHRSGFRAGDLQLHLAGADAAVRHDRRDGADGGDAAAEPQRRRRRHPGGAGRPVAGDPADDGDADSRSWRS